MQMHAGLPEGDVQPYTCGAPNATREQNASATGNFSLGMFLLAANERSAYSVRCSVGTMDSVIAVLLVMAVRRPPLGLGVGPPLGLGLGPPLGLGLGPPLLT
jgi:hypothetical protein